MLPLSILRAMGSRQGRQRKGQCRMGRRRCLWKSFFLFLLPKSTGFVVDNPVHRWQELHELVLVERGKPLEGPLVEQ